MSHPKLSYWLAEVLKDKDSMTRMQLVNDAIDLEKEVELAHRTLRDQFAMAFVSSIEIRYIEPWDDEVSESIARVSYKVADAMLKERNKNAHSNSETKPNVHPVQERDTNSMGNKA